LSGVLQGIRVVDLSRVLAGPYAGQILAEMGADVVKVEPPGGDPSRAVGPHVGGRSIYYSSLNSGKRGVVLDLRSDDGKAALAALVASADVVIHNFLPESAAALSLSPEALLERHPDLVVVTICGFARESDRATEPAFDLTIQAEAGVMSVTGEKGRPPVRAGVPLSDLIAGIWGAFGAVGALFARERGAGGSHVEIPMVDATLPLLSYMATTAVHTGLDPEPVGSGHHSLCPYGAFPTADGWIVIAVLADKFWPRLCEALALDRFARDDSLSLTGARLTRATEIDAAIAEVLAGMTTADVEARLLKAEVPHAPVRGILEALGTPYVQARRIVATVDAPEGPYATVRSPLRGSDDQPIPAPGLGQHTREVLEAVLAHDRPLLERLLGP
jgi:formyl-CoA transferase/CoA:oxalate CoA-transferase